MFGTIIAYSYNENVFLLKKATTNELEQRRHRKIYAQPANAANERTRLRRGRRR